MQAAIYAPSGLDLTSEERAFFRDADPAGYIVFKRNIATREQLRALTDDLRGLHGRAELPILIDQEGGRVARMKPPEWPAFPAGEAFARLYEKAPMSAIEAARANATAIAILLREVGVTVDCLPVLDVRQPGATDIVGDRALGSEPMQVAALGRASLDGLAAAGVAGVIKHMPGHGRALVDSHEELPVVSASLEALEIDLEPFRTLRSASMGMTCHCVYTAWDPERPDRLRRLPHVRRHRHERARRRLRRAGAGRDRGGDGRGSSLLRKAGGNDGRGEHGGGAWRQRPRAAGAGHGRAVRSARRLRLRRACRETGSPAGAGLNHSRRLRRSERTGCNFRNGSICRRSPLAMFLYCSFDGSRAGERLFDIVR
jgi:hypothetical protein